MTENHCFYFCLCVAFVLSSCTQTDEKSETAIGRTEDLLGLTISDIIPQKGQRTFPNAMVSPTRIFSSTVDVPLYTPGLISGDDMGNLFVFDYGDFTLKQYNIDRGFVRTFCLGRGRGPAEFQSAMGISIFANKEVAILDMYNQKIEVFTYGAELIETIELDKYYVRFAVAPVHQYYLMGLFPEFLFTLTSSTETIQFPQLDPVFMQDRIHFSGFIEATSDGIIYSPFAYNFFVRYDNNGNQLYASETISPVTKAIKQGDNSRSIGIDDDLLFIQARNVDLADSLFTIVDIYDVKTGEYLHSLRTNYQSSLLYANKNYLYSIQDTTISISRVELTP